MSFLKWFSKQMGCSASSQKDDKYSYDPSKDVPGQRAKPQPLTSRELLARIEGSPCPKSLDTPLFKLKYAWLSQRGYYPEALTKPNQDSYTVRPSLADKCHYFAVYDGHGKDGHDCAYFCRDHLHVLVQENLRGLPALTRETILPALKRSHIAINRQVAESFIDDSFSGTTAISVLFVEDTIYVSNVGDSRAIMICQDSKGKYYVVPLSQDQTPYRKDERDRVKQAGARVLSMEQLEGNAPIHENWGNVVEGNEIDESGDPPRVWSPYGDFPGTAFSRSIGDSVAKELGVIPEPEIHVRKITPEDKYIVIASDGVFEFMTNQVVMDIVVSQHDVQAASQALLNKAYELWLRYEVRTDDITAIVIELSDIPSAQGAATTESPATGATPAAAAQTTTASAQTEFLQPKVITKGRSFIGTLGRERKSTFFTPIPPLSDGETIEDIVINVDDIVEKSESEKESILNSLKNAGLFSSNAMCKDHSVLDLLKRRSVVAGEVVIEPGEDTGRFYVIGNGTFEVLLHSDDDAESESEVVHTYENTGCFGDVSLMQSHGVSTVAKTDGELWYMDKGLYRYFLHKNAERRKRLMGVVKTGAVVGSIQVHLLQELMDSLQERVYEAGTTIAATSADLKGFFIVSNGSCDVLSNEGAVLSTFNEFDCFGSESQVTLDFTVDRVVAKTACTLLFLSQMDLDNVLIANETSVEQPAAAAETSSVAEVRLQRSDVSFHGFLSSSTNTMWSIGSIGADRNSNNSSIHSFTISRMGDIDLKKNPIARCKEASVLLACNKDTEFSVPFFVPVYKGLIKEANAVHFLYSTVLSSEIAGLYDRVPNKRFDSNSCLYVASCIYSAVKFLHARSIVFRNVQSEGIHIDSKGRVVLVDYSVSKVLSLGSVDTVCERTYTLCGAKEYIAPEQLDTEGYGVSVDFWALGILLYEMASGGLNPFVTSKPNEVINEFAVWSRVKALGTPDFPVISFPESIAPGTVQDLISNFIVPSPKNRLGTRRAVKVRADSSGSIDGVAFSSMFGDFSPARLSTVESPLLAAAQAQSASITAAGTDGASSAFELWAKPLDPNPDWLRDF